MAATSGDENAARDRALDMLDPERAFNARSAMDTLRNLSRLLESVNGSRKSVLFFSEGIDYNVADIMGKVQRYASDVTRSIASAVSAAQDPMIELARWVDPDARALRKVSEAQGEVRHQAYAAIARARNLAGSPPAARATSAISSSLTGMRNRARNSRSSFSFSFFCW